MPIYINVDAFIFVGEQELHATGVREDDNGMGTNRPLDLESYFTEIYIRTWTAISVMTSI